MEGTKMTDQIGIYNHETGLNEIREMTSEEKAVREKEVSDYLAFKAAKAEAAAKAQADKEALLAKLGITADEAKLLLS
jgi:hypothetical protein